MKCVNLIIVFDVSENHVLMCHRQKDPYVGLYNFVGGKKEGNETDLEGAYRELHEETGITSKDIQITPLFSTQYHQDNLELQVFFGTLNHPVVLKEEAHPLVWIPVEENFADKSKFAGHGNIAHMIAMIFEGQQ